MKGEISLRYILYASPEEVFQAFTQQELIQQWSKAQGRIDLQPGGKFEWFDGWVQGIVQQTRPPRLLIFTWKPSEWSKRTTPSHVRIEISAHQAGSLVEIIHKGFSDPVEMEKHRDGWIDHVLEPMNEFFTSKKFFINQC
jgi:uncharacterized protein YndB with AHSA1/START domain